MNDRLNTFIDDDGLSESTSLTHLLNCSDHSELDDIDVINHSPYFTECDFQNLITSKGTLKSWRSENHTPHYYWLNQSK